MAAGSLYIVPSSPSIYANRAHDVTPYINKQESAGPAGGKERKRKRSIRSSHRCQCSLYVDLAACER